MTRAFYLVFFLAGAAHAAHPLNTEDTGTQGDGRWQFEANGERTRDAGVRGAQAAALLSYGLGETVDLQVGLPWQDTGTERGVGDAIAALKWRFWEKDALSFGVRAGVTLPSGDEERGLGNGRATWAALLIGTYEAERWTFLGHLGYRRNHNSVGDRESIGEISGAVLYKATERLKLLADVSRTTNPDAGSDTAIRNTVLGAIYALSKDIDLDAGVRWGNEPALADRALMAGITLRW